MSYRIQYTSVGPDMPKKSGKRKWIVISICVLAVGIFVSNFLGSPWLEEIILPNGSSIIESLEVAVSQLQEGSSFSDAISAFCRDVIFHGQ